MEIEEEGAKSIYSLVPVSLIEEIKSPTAAGNLQKEVAQQAKGRLSHVKFLSN